MKSQFIIALLFLLFIYITSDNMYSNSDFVEKEQPALSDETKRLISLYQRNPTDENYQNLRNEVIKNYDAVIAHKQEKLAELKEETLGKPGGEAVVAEMEEIVQEMLETYWDNINGNMLRFTDPRLLKWNTSNAKNFEYIPVMGAGETIYISRTTITNFKYQEYIFATGNAAPKNWQNGVYPDGEEDFPVNYVSYNDALNYCKWLTENDLDNNTYRLPNEAEWELAAGHMPKDAEFNDSGEGRTSVYAYDGITRGAHGAIDFWGNVWEWTSTVRSESADGVMLAVKGGAYDSDRTDCRTEYREESRNANNGYENVGFRIIQVLKGVEPEQNVEEIYKTGGKDGTNNQNEEEEEEQTVNNKSLFINYSVLYLFLLLFIV